MQPPSSGQTQAFPEANREERTEGFMSPKTVTREAFKILAARGVDVRPAMVRRLVKRFITDGHTTLAALEPFILDYADPTGETAVRNVDRARAGGRDAA